MSSDRGGRIESRWVTRLLRFLQYDKSRKHQNQQPIQLQQSQNKQIQNNIPQDYTSLYNLGLTLIEEEGILVVVGDDIFSKKDSIKACGFYWDGSRKMWYKTIEQEAA